MNAHYDQVIAALRDRGISAEFHRPHQLVLPSRIWISWNQQWFISTWVPACYPVPPDVDIVELCVECLHSTDATFYTIPDEIARRYRLERMSNADFDRLILIPADDNAED